MLVGELSLDDTVGEDGIGGRDAGGEGKGVELRTRSTRSKCGGPRETRTNETCGIKAHTSRLDTSHLAVMMGPSSMARLRHSFSRYFLGSCTPASTSCTPSTSRVKARVMASSSDSEPDA